MQLKEALDLYGQAINENSAWGYSPYPTATRLADGKIKVITYHFEGELSEHVCDTPEEVDFYLYTEGSVSSASLEGKKFEARLVLGETGFTLNCTIDGTPISSAEYQQTLTQEMKRREVEEDGWDMFPDYWSGPGEWDKEV